MLRKRVKLFVAGCFYYSGLVQLAQWWRQRSKQNLVILNYHRATGGDLRRHLLYLHRHYRMLPLEEALEELYTADKEGKQVRDHRTPLVLTFDDGYRDNYRQCVALSSELQVPMTIFLVPGYIESGTCFWWLEGDRCVRQASVDTVTLEGCTYHLDQPEARKALTQAIYTRACRAKAVAEREAFLAAVREALDVPSGVTAGEETALTWAEVREMEASGWISFGAHTMHHPVLAYLSDPAEVQREVKECRTVIEQQLGHPVRTFAYPLGKAEHIGEEGLRAVREAGYEWAVTTIDGIDTPQSDPHLLHRIVGDVSRHWLVMAAEIAGLWQFLSPLRKYSMASGGRDSNPTLLRLLIPAYWKTRGRML